jgi:hypothetical protein
MSDNWAAAVWLCCVHRGNNGSKSSADDTPYADIQVVKDLFADRYQPAPSIVEANKLVVNSWITLLSIPAGHGRGIALRTPAL